MFFMLLHVKNNYLSFCVDVFTLCVLPTSSSGILSDLFPGVCIPEHDYGVLRSTIMESLVKRNLQPLASMTNKVQGGKVMIP